MNNKIKKCPWCGCVAVVRSSPLGYFVECSKNGHIHNVGCFNINMPYGKTQEQAINLWNDAIL